MIVQYGTRRLIMFTGEIADLVQQIHDQAMEDPALSQAIITAAVAIDSTNRSKQLGDRMIDMILTPQNR